uniref:Nucleolar protein 14 n=2 Tax=Dendroctonus ponderosae TaxID=77166 RepID=A0AAR5P094_DENPD
MNGFSDSSLQKVDHRSADDLDDDFLYESDIEDNMLTYDDQGQANIQVHAELNGNVIGDSDGVCPDSNNEDANSNSAEEESSDEEEAGSESDDSLADLKAQDGSDESESEADNVKELTCSQNKLQTIESGQKRKLDDIAEPTKSRKKQQIEIEKGRNIVQLVSENEKKELEKAGNELPFTYKLPDSYENFLETFKNQSAVHQKIILERMIKCNHPSLSQGNKDGLGHLFVYVLQYINDLFGNVEDSENLSKSFTILTAMTEHIFALAQLNKESTHNSILEVIKEKHEEYRKKNKRYPGLELLIFFKLVSLLFSTSDFRHQIVTPCFIFMEQILKCCRVKTARDISYGLFVCTLVLEYTALSKRFLPAVINYICGILHMAIPKTGVKLIKILPPFKSISSHFVVCRKFSGEKLSGKHKVSNLVQLEINDEFKVSTLFLSLKILNDFIDQLKNLPSSIKMFTEPEKFVREIPMDLYPEIVKDVYQKLCNSFAELKAEHKMPYLVIEAKKPKALRLYEPKIVQVYEGKRRKVQSREKSDRDKLIHKLKKETKGALREIRRDKDFLAGIKLKQKIQSDKERRDKVNKILAEAAIQQSELNAMDRKKKKQSM